MCSDPKPHHNTTMATRQRAIMVTDPDGPNIPDQRLELHGRMERIGHPDLKLFSGQTLDVCWQSIELVPESTMRSGPHGISRSRPALMSSSTSRRTLSSFPSA